MDEKIRSALCAPFPANLVKTRPGSFGKKNVRYLPASMIISRISDVAQGDWSFRIVSHQVLENGEVLVLGRLEVLGVVKEAFGRCASVSRDGEVIRSLGDCYKSAATQALVVAARLTGIAAYLYSDDIPDQADDKPVPAKPARPNNVSRDRLTQKQLGALWNLSRSLKLDSEALRKRSVETFGVQPEQLSKVDASALISKLGEEMDKRRAA